MNKCLLATILLAAFLLSLIGCGGSGTSDTSTLDYLPSYIPPLNIGITDRLPAAQVSTIIGAEMTASDSYEDGTWVIYTSADSTKQVSVNMKNLTAALFDTQMMDLNDCEPLPSLGERAYWYPATGEVICFHAGYSIGVAVTDPRVSDTKGLCVALVSKLIDNLQ